MLINGVPMLGTRRVARRLAGRWPRLRNSHEQAYMRQSTDQFSPLAEAVASSSPKRPLQRYVRPF